MIKRFTVFVFALSRLVFAETQTAPGSTIEIRKPDRIIADADVARVAAVAFNQNGSILATAGDDKVVKLWDASKGVLVGVLAGHSGHISSVSFSKDGKMLAASSPPESKVWDVATGKIVLNPPDDFEAPAVAFSPDGAQVGAAVRDGTIKIRDVKTGTLMASLEGHSGEVLSLAFSPNGRTLVSGGADRSIRHWTIPLPLIPPDDLRKIEAAASLVKATAKPKINT